MQSTDGNSGRRHPRRRAVAGFTCALLAAGIAIGVPIALGDGTPGPSPLAPVTSTPSPTGASAPGR